MPLNINEKNDEVTSTPSIRKTEKCMEQTCFCIGSMCCLFLIVIFLVTWFTPLVVYIEYKPLHSMEGKGWGLLNFIIIILIAFWPFILGLLLALCYSLGECFDDVCEICDELNHYIWVRCFLDAYPEVGQKKVGVEGRIEEGSSENQENDVSMVNLVALED